MVKRYYNYRTVYKIHGDKYKTHDWNNTQSIGQECKKCGMLVKIKKCFLGGLNSLDFFDVDQDGDINISIDDINMGFVGKSNLGNLSCDEVTIKEIIE
jgi:hypothetical protein